QGLNLLMGLRTDPPIDAWDASFLPVEFLEHTASIERVGPDGTVGPLLGPRQVLFEASRDPVPATPSGFSVLWLLGGAVAAVSILLLARRARDHARCARIALGSMVTLWALTA